MKKLKLVYLIGTIALAIGCQNNEIIDNTICETSTYLGECLLLEESIESGLIYDSYNKVFFQNDNDDTLAFEINYLDSLFYHNRIAQYDCNLDATVQIDGEYAVSSKSLLLSNLNQNLIGEIGNIKLIISTLLHLDEPESVLFGDFLFLREIELQMPSTLTNNIMVLPIDLRTYPIQIQEMEGFDFIEEVEQNGITYNEVFSSNEMSDSDLKIQMTKTDGITKK